MLVLITHLCSFYIPASSHIAGFKHGHASKDGLDLQLVRLPLLLLLLLLLLRLQSAECCCHFPCLCAQLRGLPTNVPSASIYLNSLSAHA